MNHYDLNRIFRMLQENGLGGLYVLPTNDEGHLGVILLCQRRNYDELR